MEPLWSIGPALPASLADILHENDINEEMEDIEDMDGDDKEISDDEISDEEE